MRGFSDIPFRHIASIALAASTPASAQNLIVNGDFESGNAAFTSHYDFGDDTVPEGTYCIATDPVLCSPLAADFHDHTTGHGNMMVVDGAVERRVVVWKERVSVAPSTTYLLACWCASWGRNGNGDRDPSPALLRFTVAGIKVGHFKPHALDGAWRRFEFPWRSGPAQTSATIVITDGNTAATGNDFALDDLSFTPAQTP